MFFIFKQKTAYELRISDWSSDVCSSDLPPHHASGDAPCSSAGCQRAVDVSAGAGAGRRNGSGLSRIDPRPAADRGDAATGRNAFPSDARQRIEAARRSDGGDERSEEHTYELQSLMRISYAVFCLKKKTTRVRSDNYTTK